MYLNYFKAFFDFFAAFFGLLFLFPFLLMIAVIIKLSSKGPVFYAHERVAKNFNSFKLLKFRTMVVDADQKGVAVTHKTDPRITKIGAFLRRYKLDELPQLLNVLKGDISLVGPRPESRKYVDCYLSDYEKILTIKPGITDYAAIEFRDEESLLEQYDDKEKGYIEEVLPQKIKLYYRYMKDSSFLLDLRLIFKTVF